MCTLKEGLGLTLTIDNGKVEDASVKMIETELLARWWKEKSSIIRVFGERDGKIQGEGQDQKRSVSLGDQVKWRSLSALGKLFYSKDGDGNMLESTEEWVGGEEKR